MTGNDAAGMAKQLLDIEEIKGVKARYFRCLDTRDWDGWGEVFAEQVVLEVPEADAVMEGRATIVRSAHRRLGDAAGDVDVVIDYLWGEPAADALIAIATNRTDSARPLTWIEIGSVAGPTAPVPSAALRAIRLQIVGSGQGSVPTRDILAELGELATEISKGTFQIGARAVALEEIGAVWNEPSGTERIVICPG